MHTSCMASIVDIPSIKDLASPLLVTDLKTSVLINKVLYLLNTIKHSSLSSLSLSALGPSRKRYKRQHFDSGFVTKEAKTFSRCPGRLKPKMAIGNVVIARPDHAFSTNFQWVAKPDKHCKPSSFHFDNSRSQSFSTHRRLSAH